MRRFLRQKVSSGCMLVRSHSHSHSHGSGHGHSHSHSHSHGKLEDTITGKNLRDCKIVTIVGGATNVFFCITKILIGSSGGSVALVADGFHAFTDILADIASYLTLTFSKKKLPRCRFPFGLTKLEPIGTVLVAAILLFAGIALLVQSLEQCTADAARYFDLNITESHESHHEHHHTHSHSHSHDHSHFQLTTIDATGHAMIMWSMVVLSASSVLCKELLYRWARRVGERAKSNVVVANAFHHRADAWSGAVALVGVGGQVLGVFGVDGIAGLVVSSSIFHIGYTLCRDAVLDFFDYQRGDEIEQLREKLSAFHIEEDSTEDCKTSVISVFSIKDGDAIILYGILLASEKLSVSETQNAIKGCVANAKTIAAVDEFYFKLHVCSLDLLPNEENASIYAKGLYYNPSLDACIEEIRRFHFIWETIWYDLSEKIICLSLDPASKLSPCCLADVRTVARMYGCELKTL